MEPTPEGGSLSEQGEGRLNAVEKCGPTMTILNLKVNPEVWLQGKDVEETHQLTQDFKKRNCRSTPEKESTCPVQWQRERWRDFWNASKQGWPTTTRKATRTCDPGGYMWRAWLWWWVTCVLVKRNVKKILHGWCNHCLWQQECGGEYCTSFTAAGTVKSRLKFHEKGLESTVAIARKVIHLTNGAVSSVYSGW